MYGSILTPIIVFVAAGLLIYRVQLFHRKAIWNMSLHQIFTLIIAPGLLFPRIFAYIDAIKEIPLKGQVIFSDALLTNIILLSLIFTYGGVAIHSVTKMLSHPDLLRYDKTEAGEINRYFHQTFSHSLMYAGGLSALIGITLLETNHMPTTDPISIFWGAIRGLGLGLMFFLMMRNYTRYWYEDDYGGRWIDLKMVFVVVWVGFMMILYSIRKLDPRITDYQLLLPSLLSLAVLGFVNIFLVFRRLKRGSFQVHVRWSRLKNFFLNSD